MSTFPKSASTLILLAAITAACGSTGQGAAPPASPSSPGAPTAALSGIDHPTGPAEVVLRFDESGGFVPVEFMAAHVPWFTLYGDGTIVFVQSGAAPDPRPDGIVTGSSLRTGRLNEDQVQALLELALGDGGLAIARAEYQNPLVADAPTAVFEIHAAGSEKTVSVVALGMEGDPGPDSAVKAALAKLGERLRDFDKGGAFASAPFVPAAYRAVLTDAGGAAGAPARAWPWPAIKIDDFAFPADPNALRQGTRAMTTDEVAALGIDGIENGIQSGVSVTGPDGVVYSLVVRPLLPDETA